MAKDKGRVTRKDGLTIIKWGNFTITTNRINRFTYNDLRKKNGLTPEEIIKSIFPQRKK